ncbi:GH92 family glycosyl hydrolase [Pontiellaceae bacterium B1224]|nr:GH92 family glycosyl hydrolase [Pontiellaceae bacterium B1224]
MNSMKLNLLNACSLVFLIFVSGFERRTNAEQPVDLVYPQLDSANSRWFFFDSASRPFGMVNLSPDTELGGAWGSGYRYHSKEIKGFSHVHAWQLSALSVMPIASAESVEKIKGDFYSGFSHETEEIAPGYHKLTLDRYGIEVELTATDRVGFHRYTYSKSAQQQVLFQLSGNMGPVELGYAEAWRKGTNALAGFVTNEATRRRFRPTKVFFYAELNRPIATFEAWNEFKTISGGSSIAGREAGLLLGLEGDEQEVLMKVGISYVSAENAQANMDAELPGWDFDAAVSDARMQWNEWLSVIKVEGGTRQQQRRFYTDLWHALQGRRIISDASGEYTDQTGPIARTRQIPIDEDGRPLFNHHNSDSFWGAQWTIATLWPLAYPEVASNVGNSLLQYYRDGGQIPRGPSGGNYTYVMTGASATPFLVSNYMKGLRDTDIDLLYQALKESHSESGIMSRAGYEHFTQTGGGMKYYLEKGYIPFPLPAVEKEDGFHLRGTGQTLEYAFQDHTLAQLAEALGHPQDAETYANRAQNYRNAFDAESGFMRPRNPDGSWQTPYDPYEYENGFVESNPAQGTWFVPHDVLGLADLMGGRDVAIQRLETAFQESGKQDFTAGKAHSQEAKKHNRRIPINYGNQPSMQAAFLFSPLGAPWKTQYWSRQVVDAVYSDLDPEHGYSGDEDQGLMGSLAVLMKIGLFQLTAGTEPDPIYWIGSPIFDRIEISLDRRYYPGATFIIKALNNSPENVYIQSIKLNGNPLKRTYLRHSEIVQGGELELTMSPQPNKALGSEM